MKKQKLTPWFPRYKQPVRPGVYEADPRDFPSRPFPLYSFFDGKYFRGCWTSVGLAQGQRHFSARFGQEKDFGTPVQRWRGLAQDPNKA